MDERAAQALAVALCGQRLRRRRAALVFGLSALAILTVVLAALLVLPVPTAARSAALLPLAFLVAAALAIVVFGIRFPQFGDAYRDLGLDPLTPAQHAAIDALVDAHPQLLPELAFRTAYGVPLRVRDLHQLRRLARREHHGAHQLR